MPTLAPACHLVPRWRAMMLPGMTTSPPYCFRPRRRPAESRPLREDPPAFLCAIVRLQHLAWVVTQIYDEITSLLFAFAAFGGRLLGFLGRSLGGFLCRSLLGRGLGSLRGGLGLFAFGRGGLRLRRRLRLCHLRGLL